MEWSGVEWSGRGGGGGGGGGAWWFKCVDVCSRLGGWVIWGLVG